MIKKVTETLCMKGGKDDLGHKLWAARILEGHHEGRILVFCAKCGCAAVSAVRGLGKQCRGPGERGHEKTVPGRSKSGEHPDERREGKIGDPWPLCRGGFSFEAAAQGIMKAKKESKGPKAGIVAAGQRQRGGVDAWLDGQADQEDVALEELVGFVGADVLDM